MKQTNIISAAQARFNFCKPEYVKVYKQICEGILERSKNERSLTIAYTSDPSVTLRIKSELNDLGYDFYTAYDRGNTVLTISW